MRIAVPWSTSTINVEVADERVAGVLGARAEAAEDPARVLREALAQPGVSFAEFLVSASSPLLVVVNDATRPTPSAEVLREIRGGLETWAAVPSRELSFVVTTGTHRAALPEEVSRIFGADWRAPMPPASSPTMRKRRSTWWRSAGRAGGRM